MLITILVFLLILSVLVLIHEFGHFIVARRAGVKVEEFGFGFPPRVWGIKRGETIYSINLFPIGGFVKLYGEDEAGGGKINIKDQSASSGKKIKDIDRTFFAKTPLQKFAIGVAGVVMNAVLAVAIFYIYLFISGFKAEIPRLFDHNFFLVNQENRNEVVIGSISNNSPAQKVGLKPISKVISVNGNTIDNMKEFVEIINLNKGKEVIITWKNLETNQTKTAKVIPRVDPPKNEGALGVGLIESSTAVMEYETPFQKIFSGIIHPANLMVYNLEVIGKLIAISFQEKTATPVGQAVAGPVGIYSLVGNILQIPDLKERVLQMLNLTGLLSVTLAFFNVLPFPGLDGGRLVFITYEMIVGKRVNPKYEALIHSVGIAFLFGLLIIITFRDLSRIFSGQGLFGP